MASLVTDHDIHGVLDRSILPFHRNEQRQRRTDTSSVQPRLDLLA
jgi:hypothetical protein